MIASASSNLSVPPSGEEPALAFSDAFDARLLDAVAAISGDHISVADRDGYLLYVSASYASALGRKRDELAGRSLQEIYPEDGQAARMLAEHENVFQTGKPYHGARHLSTPQGGRDIEYTLSPLFAESAPASSGGADQETGDTPPPAAKRAAGMEGPAVAVMSVGRDVTRRNQAENALRRSVDNLDFALKGAQVGTFYCDWPFDKIIWNETCKEHFFLPPDAEIDISLFYALLHPEDRERTRQAIERCMSERVQYDVEYRAVAPDGRWRWINAIGRGFYDAQGEPYRFDGITFDITRRKLAEADMQRQSAEIQAINARLKHAMHETHHRVRNSLQLVSAFMDIQASDYKEAVPTNNVRHLNSQVRTLSAVHDVMTLEARNDYEASMVSAQALLEKLLSLTQNAAGERKIGINIADARLPVRAGTPLALIANELVLNALEYGKGRVEIRFRVENAQASLQVSDDGPGFPADFNPHEKANTGLELVEQLARWDLGGSVTYANRSEPSGAQITVTFPLLDAS